MKLNIGMAAAVGILCAMGVTTTAQNTAPATGDRAEKRATRIEAVKEKRDAKFDERMAEWQTKHDALITKLKDRLAKSKKLTPAEQTEIVTFFEDQYKENTTFRNQQHEENMKFLDTLMGETDLTKAELKDKIKAHVDEQKAQNKEHRAMQKGERQAEHAKVKAERKDGAAAGN